jgi:hypothetical protein
VADQIKRYLAKHPGAADTVAGICDWWLPGVPEPLVQRALDELMSEGLVKRHEVPGGRPVYSRATRPSSGSRPASTD